MFLRRILGYRWHDYIWWPGTQGGWFETSHQHSSRTSTTPLRTCGATPCRGSRPSNPVLSGSEGLDNAEGPPACFVGRTRGVLSEAYRHGGPCVSLGDGRTEGKSNIARWSRQCTAPAYAPIPDLTWHSWNLDDLNHLTSNAYHRFIWRVWYEYPLKAMRSFCISSIEYKTWHICLQKGKN